MIKAAALASAHWNETPLYLTEEARYSEYPWLYEAGEFKHHSGERVLEIGCGTGCDLFQFAKHGAIATGVNITESHLALARQRVGNLATILYGDMLALPFDDNSFDYVYSHGVIHHSDEPKQAVREIFRVLRPGGKFNVHVYAWFSESAAIYFLKYGFALKRHIENSTAKVHIDFYGRYSLKRLFAPAKITVNKFQCYHLHWAAPWLGGFLVAKGTNPQPAIIYRP